MPLPPTLRHLLTRASLPASHFPGQKKMQLSSALATEVIRSLVVLQDSSGKGTGGTRGNIINNNNRIPIEMKYCFTQISKRDPALVGGALQRTLLDPNNPTHGPRLHFLVDCLAGPLHTEEVSWLGIVRQAELALNAGKWHPRDIRNILRGISIAGVYPSSLANAAERYVSSKLAFADNKELGLFSGILTSLPETRTSPLLRTLADRATSAIGSPSMTLASLGSVCRSFLRAQYYDQNFVGKIAAAIPNIVAIAESSENEISSSNAAKQRKNISAKNRYINNPLPFHSAVAIFTLWSLTGFSSDGRIRNIDDEIADRQKEKESSSSSSGENNNNNIDSENNNLSDSRAPPPAFASLCRLISTQLQENDDIDLLLLLLRGISSLRTFHWDTSVSKELDSLLAGVSVQCQAFLEIEEALSVDLLSSMLPKYFLSLKRRPHRLAPNENLEPGVEAFCSHLDEHVEEYMGVESPPFNLVAPLLDHGTPCCKKTVIKILEEAKIQDAPLPTLQTMRFLLECADSQTFNSGISRYLRKNFSLTTEGIPLVQLTSAMHCFAIAEKLFPSPSFDDDNVWNASEHDEDGLDIETRIEEKNIFVDDILQFLERQTSYKWDLRCLMRLAASLDIIIGVNKNSTLSSKSQKSSSNTSSSTSSSNRQQEQQEQLQNQQRGRMTMLLSKKMSHLVDNAEPQRYSKTDAVACLSSSFVSQISVVPDNVHKFLAACSVDGEDDSMISPTRWMIINDPASFIVERTLEQQKVDEILVRLRLVPLEDMTQIIKLVADYLQLFHHVHPDEVRFLFELFADRTIKNDRLLKETLVCFMSSGSVKKVSVFSVASILNSCAQIRFAYIPLVKQMLASITDEQWSLIDAIELELLLVALQRLSIRVPSILMTLGEKALQLVGALTGSQASSLIAAFQALGFYEEVVMMALVKRASECAPNMSAMTLSVLLGGPHAHRLPFAEDVAAPIVRRLSEIAPELAPHQRSRIATTLKKTSLPVEMLAGATTKLAIDK